MSGMTSVELLDPSGPRRPSEEVEPDPSEFTELELDQPLAPEPDPQVVRKSAFRQSLARPTTAVVVGSMVVGAGIRLDVPRGLWLDESFSVAQARMGYGALIHNLVTTDVHPPLYFTFLWATVRLIGHGDFAVRVPSIIAGVVLIPLMYLLGKEAFDRRTGAVASVIAAFAPFLVWYSQEARMYEQLMVFSVIAVWAQLRIFRGGRWPVWVAFTLASIAMMWSQYFGMWQLMTQELVFVGAIVVRWRRHQQPGRLLRPWLCSTVPLVVAMVPLAFIMNQQFIVHKAAGQALGASANTVGTASLSIYSIITSDNWGVFGFHSNAVMLVLSALWPFGILGAMAVLGRRSTPTTYLLCALAVVPMFAMFALGHVKESLFDIRYMATIVPVILVLAARVITAVARRPRALFVVVLLVVAVLCVALFDQQFSSANPRRYNDREALQRIDQEARPGDVILYDPARGFNDLTTYYSPNVRARALTLHPTPPSPGHSIYVVATPQIMVGTELHTLQAALGSLGFRHPPAAHWIFAHVQVWVYR